MVQPGIALAFSGAIGSGKSSVSGELQKLLEWPRVSFGDFVRKTASSMGRDATDRDVLQKLGQALVVSNLEGFVRDVLAQAPEWADADGVIIDGLRHTEVREELIRQVHPKQLKLVIVNVDEGTRLARAQKEKDIESHVLSRYDQDVTETQTRQALPNFADLQVENDLSPVIAAEAIIRKLNLHSVKVRQ
jgi:adenylate kinase family enzyme